MSHRRWNKRPNGPHWPVSWGLFGPLFHFLCDIMRPHLVHSPMIWNGSDALSWLVDFGLMYSRRNALNIDRKEKRRRKLKIKWITPIHIQSAMGKKNSKNTVVLRHDPLKSDRPASLKKFRDRNNVIYSFSSVGSVTLGLLNEGANLHFPARWRWGESNFSPNTASKIPPLLICQGKIS